MTQGSGGRRALFGGFDFADALLMLVPALCVFPLRNNDLWWHLAAGRELIARHAFLRGDPFSFTGFMGSWVDNEWLSQLAFYATWWLGGPLGLVVLRAGLFTLVFLLVRGLLRAGRQPGAFFPCLVAGIALSYGWWELRPSVVSLIGTLLLLIVLETERRSGRGLAWLPLLFLAWASAHPGFLFGLCILAASLAAVAAEPLLPGWRRWTARPGAAARLGVATAVSVLATLVNPYGWRVYTQQIAIARNTAYRAVLDEWVPPSPAFVVLVIVTLGVLFAARTRRIAPAAWMPILGASALATTGVRFQEYFALIAVPALFLQLGPLKPVAARTWLVPVFLAASIVVGLRNPLSMAMDEGFPGASGRESAEQRLAARLEHNAVLLSALLLAAGVAAARRGRGGASWLIDRSRGRSHPALAGSAVALAGVLAWGAARAGRIPADFVEPDRYPGACLGALNRPEGRVFNRLSWGGWIVWNAGAKTFIDGRQWGQPIFFEYQECRGSGWRPVFAKWAIDGAIVPGGDPLAAALAADPEWEWTCADDVSAVFRRRGLSP